MRFFKTAPGLNVNMMRGGISMRFPVAGLTEMRSSFLRGSKTPKPCTETESIEMLRSLMICSNPE